MSALARVEYMDNQRVQIIAQQIQKEKKIQREYYKAQEEAGTLAKWQPPTPVPAQTLLERVGVPEFVSTSKQDPALSLGLSLSKNMWTSNPGYILRDGQHTTSLAKTDFVWNQEEIDYMKQHGEFHKTHNKKKDEFVNYVEAAARSRQLGKKSG